MHSLILALMSIFVWAGSAQASRYEENYDDHGIEIVCESKKGRTQYCSLDTRYGVILVEQHSRAACIEGESWGYDQRGVWVQAGCRASFITAPQPRNQGRGRGRDDGRSYGGGYDRGYDDRRNAPVLILCESHGYEPFYCQMPTRGRVVLVNQLSRSACHFGSDWGFDRRGVWVANGCRAEFAVE